jgi:hypothetical protein
MPKTTKPVKTWLDAFNEYDNPHQISKTDFRKILYAFNTLLYQSIIYEGKSYKLPHGIGTFSVLKGKTAKRGYFDYDSYNKHGIKRFIRNHHSAGMVAKVK